MLFLAAIGTKAGDGFGATFQTGGWGLIGAAAIVHDPQGSTPVYVYYPDRKRVHARRVETGPVRDRGVEIRSGLSGEELVVVAGPHKVREGSLVEVTP